MKWWDAMILVFWMLSFKPTFSLSSFTFIKRLLSSSSLSAIKVVSSGVIWSNGQIWPWNMELSRAKANRVLPREHTGHRKHPLPQHKRRLYTWTSPDGQYQNQTECILCSKRCRSSIQSAKTRPGADCGSDHELLIAKFRLKLKKVGKTTRPLRYDLNQISYSGND